MVGKQNIYTDYISEPAIKNRNIYIINWRMGVKQKIRNKNK